MKNSVSLVTGGAGHIGSETCRKLAARGVHLAIVDKNEAAARALVEELQSKFKVKAAYFGVDLQKPASFEEIRKKIENEFGRLDFIVNNAAFYDDIPGFSVPFEQETYEAWQKVMSVNLLAPFFLVQALVPLLRQSPGAAVVNVSSIYGVVGPDHGLYEGTEMTNPAVYSASKAGLIQVTKWLSTVLAPTIRVNTVTPGGVERGQLEIFQKRYLARTPLKRMATEEDVANAIAFLLSPESSYITGHNLLVDGGWTVW